MSVAPNAKSAGADGFNSGPSELAQVIATLRPYLVRSFGFALIAALLVLAPSAYMLEVYARVIDSRSHLTLVMLTMVVLGAYAVMEVLEWARSQLLHGAGLALDRRLGDRIFAAMFTAHLRRLPGGTPQTMADFRSVREFLGSGPVQAAMEAPVSMVFLALIFAMHPLLGWTALISALLQVFIGWLNERATQPPLVAANRMAQSAQLYADSSLRNAQVIEALGMQGDVQRRWSERQQEMLNLQAVASDRAGGFQALTKTFQLLLGSVLIGLGAWLLLRDQMPGGAGLMIVASILGGRVLSPLVIAVAQWRTVVQLRDAWGRLAELLATVPVPPPSMRLPAPTGRLQVEHLVAAAPGNPAPILRGVAFALTPGEVMAVIGPSACGKTSLARLLVGIWPAAGGKVRLDGADVFAWDKTELGPHLGYLPQEVELFDGTLGDNIARFGMPDPQLLESASRAAGLESFITALPEGFDTPVGSDGMRLSGGQRQRIGLARALYGNPVLVVLDEPNSSLDEAGDAALARAIAQYKARGTTFVVITHRTGVLGVADKILLLRDGQMQAFGPRDEVLAALAQANAASRPVVSTERIAHAT